MRFAAFLFDLDGTLIESIDLWQQAYLNALTAIGISMTTEQFMAEVYGSDTRYKAVLARHGITDDETVTAFKTQRDNEYCQLLSERSVWLPQAEATLQAIKTAGRPMGLITGSWRPYVEAIDTKLNLKQYFDTVITASDMTEQKPHPNGLLLAANALQIDPVECVYIGDQPFDIAAANAALMTSCLVWGNHTPVGADQQAKITLDTIADVTQLL